MENGTGKFRPMWATSVGGLFPGHPTYFLFLLRHRIITFNGQFIKSFFIARISITLSGASTAAAYRMTVGDELLNRLVPSVVDASGPHLDWLKWEVSQ